jgi:hypothetical protein
LRAAYGSVNMLAREYCDDIKRKMKPVILSHHMLMGLKQARLDTTFHHVILQSCLGVSLVQSANVSKIRIRVRGRLER